MNGKNKDKQPVRVGLISLGCAKNLVDAEVMLGSLLKSGMEITSDPRDADAVIVNTCSFIDAAQEESIDTILESDRTRDGSNRRQALLVSGCLSQRFRDELPKLLPEVDGFMGIDQVAEAPDLIRRAINHRQNRLAELSPEPAVFDVTKRPVFIPDFSTPRFQLTPKHFAYVKIAEGCNHPCSFCTIPKMRGTHRSRAQADILKDARRLIKNGVKELNLISQDSTYYGLDLRPERNGSIASPEKFNAATNALSADATTLCTLLRELNAIPGDFWIRLLYTHPAHWTDELIETIAECPKVARYIDIPLQHIHPAMLKTMRRETSKEYIVELLQRIRAGIPGIAIRTTFIVGFPGESEAHFEDLLEFIRDTKFERMGVFTYSREPGTPAGKMARQIHHKTREKRRRLAMAEQHKVAGEVSGAFVGTTLKVLVESRASAEELQQAKISSWEHGLIRDENGDTTQLEGDYLIARGEADAPDIDGRVYIKGHLPTGKFAQVKITGHTDYDLIAEPAPRTARAKR